MGHLPKGRRGDGVKGVLEKGDAVAAEKLEAKGISSYLPIVIATTVFAFVPVAMQASCMGIFFPSMVEDYGESTESPSCSGE